MPSLENMSYDTLFTMLKGEPGTHKSSQAICYPAPQYWVSFDGKMEALMRPMKHHGISGKDIQYDNFTSWEGASGARNKLESFQLNCDYRTIVVDSITTASDYILRDIRRGKQGVVRGTGKAAGLNIGGIQVNELEDFNGEAAALLELMALTKYLYENKKVNIVLIAHVIRTENKSIDGKVNITRQIVTAARKPAAKIPGYCTEIYQHEMVASLTGGEPSLEVRTVNSTDDYARTALPLDPVIKVGTTNMYKQFIYPAMQSLKG